MRSRFFSTGTTASSSQGDVSFDGKPWFDVTHSAYGATGDGSTNDATAIQAALNAANTAGGGIVFFPKGTYTVGTTLLVYSNTTLVGQGRNVSTIKLANSANTDLMQSAQYAALVGTNTLSGDHYINIADLTLDGNKANNTSGWVLRKYGSLWFVSNVEIMNGKSGGVYSEYATSAATNYGGLEDYWESVHFHHNTGDGLQFRGPHDSIFAGCFFHSNTTGSKFETAATYSADSTHLYGCHWWANNPTTGVALSTNTNLHLTDCHVEGMDGSGGVGVKMLSGNTARIRAVRCLFSLNETHVLLQTSNNEFVSCSFGSPTASTTGIQIGDASNRSDMNLFSGCRFEKVTNGVLWVGGGDRNNIVGCMFDQNAVASPAAAISIVSTASVTANDTAISGCYFYGSSSVTDNTIPAIKVDASAQNITGLTVTGGAAIGGGGSNRFKHTIETVGTITNMTCVHVREKFVTSSSNDANIPFLKQGSAGGLLDIRGGLRFSEGSAASIVARAMASGDTVDRWVAYNTGLQEWGSGSGARDTNLYRSAADKLKTDDMLIATVGIGVGNSAVATTLGTVTRKMQVFDASGNSLGYVPIYDAIS